MIPIFNLTRQYKSIKKELNTAFTQTNVDGQFILGKNVSLFEQEFARFIRVPYAVGVASGTDALMLGLTALDIKNGDEVILPANSYPTAFGVARSGAKIRLVDVSEDGCMDPEKIHSALTKKTRAVIPVHLYGNAADTKAIKKQLHKNILLVEDAAQAHGTYGAGTTGDISCFSFYPSKNLGALGDGGMVTTKIKKIADRLKRLRMYGETKRYESTEISGVSRLDELQAAFLRVKMHHLPAWIARRRAIANMYRKSLTNVGDIRFVANPKSSYHLFVIRTKFRNRLQSYLTARGIGTTIHYPTCIHLVKSFAHLGYRKGDFPVSEALAREILSIPMYPELTDAEIETVSSTIQKFFHSVV